MLSLDLDSFKLSFSQADEKSVWQNIKRSRIVSGCKAKKKANKSSFCNSNFPERKAQAPEYLLYTMRWCLLGIVSEFSTALLLDICSPIVRWHKSWCTPYSTIEWTYFYRTHESTGFYSTRACAAKDETSLSFACAKKQSGRIIIGMRCDEHSNERTESYLREKYPDIDYICDGNEDHPSTIQNLYNQYSVEICKSEKRPFKSSEQSRPFIYWNFLLGSVLLAGEWMIHEQEQQLE